MQARVVRSIGLLVLGAMALDSGCRFKSNTRSTVEMTTAGRTVKASTDKIASITFDNQNFVISFSSKKCVVEPERVLYDGKDLTRIPATATSIVIEFFEGKLKIIADGQTVFEASPL